MHSASERQINCADLIIGMFVTELDRPWTESPFMFQGFVIQNDEEIALLQRYCKYVYVDVNLGVCPTEIDACRYYHPPTEDKSHISLAETQQILQKGDTPKITLEQELVTAKGIYAGLEATFKKVIEDVRSGTQLKIPEIRDSLQPLIESIKRNPDAFLHLILISRHRTTPASDAIATAVFGAAIGIRMKLPHKEFQHLVTGTFLYDVGKLRLSQELLNQPRTFTPKEFETMKQHVNHGIEILSKAHGSNPIIVSMARHHHERFDGLGYPAGMKGEAIPVYARITAVVDCFNAITAPRAYASPMSPYHGALKLYEWRDVDFDPVIIDHLIQVIGVYPMGTLVELTNGEIGMVISYNRTSRLRPRVTLLLNEKKQPYDKYPTIDLSTQSTQKDGTMLGIKRALEPHAHGIDLDKINL